MTHWNLIDTDTLPEGSELTLYERGGAFMIRSDGLELMTTEAIRSEEAFVGFGLERLGHMPDRVLIGGLGLGFTLAEVCRQCPTTRISVVEISDAVIRWLKGPARNLNTPWLDDPRVTLVLQDIVTCLEDGADAFDLILLDIDNGPEALVHPGNARLYQTDGLQSLASRLSADGALVFWSAVEAPRFEARLRQHFSSVETERFAVPQNPAVEHFHFIASGPIQPSQDR